MSDTITQTRLSLRLDLYLRDYTEKSARKDHLSREQWEIAWKVAAVARTNKTLTPELVGDVRVALKKLS